MLTAFVPVCVNVCVCVRVGTAAEHTDRQAGRQAGLTLPTATR